MIEKDKVSRLRYLLIIAGAILAFMVLVSSPETFAQLSTFSTGGGYGYPGSFYGGYSGYGYPGYVSWNGPFANSQDSSQWAPLYQYSSGSGYGIPNPFNPIYGLVPPGYGPLWASTHSTPISPISGAPPGMAYNPLSGSYYIPGSYYTQPTQYYSSLPSYYSKFVPTPFSYYSPTSYSTTYDSSSKGNSIVTITGEVVGSYSINSNGREIKCYVHLPQQAVFQPLDLSEYMGEVVEVSGYLINQDLYDASIERVI